MLAALRPVLLAAGQAEPDIREFAITQRSICEFPRYSALSRAILDTDMPEVAGTTRLDHYTTAGGFKGIIASRQLHLAPITPRLSQGELDTFAVTHNLLGYIDAAGKVTPELAKAAANLFYASFTETAPSDHHWEAFGDNYAGFRLRFDVTPGAAGRMRAIRYHQSPTLLQQVNDALVQAGLPRFVLKGVSRVGAYYLPLVLKPENETRLLAKRFAGGGAPVIQINGHERWPIPIGATNTTAGLTLVEIGVHGRDPAIVQSRLPAWCSNVPVIKD